MLIRVEEVIKLIADEIAYFYEYRLLKGFPSKVYIKLNKYGTGTNHHQNLLRR